MEMNLSREDALAILQDHNGRTRQFEKMEGPDVAATGYNPVCGDRYRVFMRLNGARITDVRFHGFGCVLSRASASMMARSLEASGRNEAMEMIDGLRHAVLDGLPLPAGIDPDAHVLCGVRNHPSRIKCVLLPWHAASAALADRGVATTE